MPVNHHKDIALPYAETATPALQIETGWYLNRFIDYIRIWSAIVSYSEKMNMTLLSICYPGLQPSGKKRC